MARDPRASERSPDLEDVLDALEDEACRRIVKALDEPMTAQEIADATDIPQSTAYRKLDLLSEATIVDERTEIRSDGHHTTRYLVDMETVRIELDDDREFDLDIARPARSPDEQLARLWSEVRRET
jgi:DNA-binding transcriptional ArsR family regulator